MQSSQNISCPHCANTIRRTSIVCPFCKKNLAQGRESIWLTVLLWSGVAIGVMTAVFTIIVFTNRQTVQPPPTPAPVALSIPTATTPPEPTSTPLPTDTPLPPPTQTPTNTPIDTATPTDTATPLPPTSTATPLPTFTPIPTPTEDITPHLASVILTELQDLIIKGRIMEFDRRADIASCTDSMRTYHDQIDKINGLIEAMPPAYSLYLSTTSARACVSCREAALESCDFADGDIEYAAEWGEWPQSTLFPVWYKGGTLHDSTVQEWREASSHNRLATAADWTARSFDIDTPEQALLLPAFYVQCTNDIITNPNVTADQRIALVAAKCYLLYQEAMG